MRRSGDAAIGHIRHPSLGVPSESLRSEWRIHRSQSILANFLQWCNDGRAWVPNVRRWFDLSLYFILRYDVLLIMFAEDLPAGVRFWTRARPDHGSVNNLPFRLWPFLIRHNSLVAFCLRSPFIDAATKNNLLIFNHCRTLCSLFQWNQSKNREWASLACAHTTRISCQTRMRSCSRSACIRAYAKVQRVLSAIHWPPFLSLSSFQSILPFIWSIGSSLWSLLIMLRAAVRQNSTPHAKLKAIEFIFK